jgi:PKD repeat protein
MMGMCDAIANFVLHFGKMKKKLILVFIFCYLSATSQQAKRVLFLGNSLTYVNNLPQMIADVAASNGDTLIYDSNCPGGYHLYQHFGDTVSRQKIMAGNWDYVVLQEQSLHPALDTASVNFSLFPYAYKLDSMINLYNPCGETMFYMTWGYKNGCAGCLSLWPYIDTYEGMDSLLNLRYRMMADSNDAEVSPAGAVWHYIRDNFPSIDLYQSDEIHPAVAGTYAAACSFYSAIFRKDPTLITFNSSLASADAANIRSAAKVIVYDSLMNWHVGEYDLVSNFNYTHLSGFMYQFTNLSQNAIGQLWDFGVGTDTSTNPLFTFPGPGNYSVNLISFNSCDIDTFTQAISLVGINEYNSEQITVYPNPVTNEIAIYGLRFTIEKVELFNSVGEKVYESRLTEAIGRPTISVADFPSGIYFLRIQGNNFTDVKKLAVQK